MNNKKISIWGVGPKLAIITTIYSIFIIIIDFYAKPLFLIKLLPQFIFIIIGVILLIIGIPYYLLSNKTINKAYKEGKLCTTGVYAICRHPLYSSQIINVSGIVIFFRSCLLLTIPIFMYILLRIMSRKEEKYLLETYGNEYLIYRNNTGFVFPKFWKYLKNK